MAGTLVSTPANKAAVYTSWITKQDRGFKGFFNIDFTTLADGSTAPEIEAGSWIDIDGNAYLFGVQEAATGWGGIASSTKTYMKVVPAGTDITAEFTDSAPTYDDLKNGWYDGDDRYILWLFKDSGDDYTLMRTEPEVTRNLQVINDMEVAGKVQFAKGRTPSTESSGVLVSNSDQNEDFYFHLFEFLALDEVIIVSGGFIDGSGSFRGVSHVSRSGANEISIWSVNYTTGTAVARTCQDGDATVVSEHVSIAW